MFPKSIFVLFASALFAESALGQCLGRMTGPVAPCRAGLGFDGLAYNGLAMDGVWPGRAGCGAIVSSVEIAASYGGSLAVSSSSCSAPTGLAVTSENVYEGPVTIAGNLPFLGSAAMEGVFPTVGSSAISYGCGDGAVAIIAEEPVNAVAAPASIVPAAIAPGAFAPSMASWGYTGLPAFGCGCGAPYY